MTVTKQNLADLRDLNATFRLRHHGGSFIENEYGKVLPDRTKPSGGVTCDIFDKTVGEMYASATEADERLAIDRAIEIAKRTAKPMTPAQRADATRINEVQQAANGRVAELEREIARLRALIPTDTQQSQAPASPDTQAADTATSEAPVLGTPSTSGKKPAPNAPRFRPPAPPG